ncbi:RagB/SusD family nutrient uptake outer membrane protein [Hufsiella ginkgonis]|uniref:RagB/SusD family nutrient uptake outer membrane protein n=1 Tax=Hufsiella ginkgonis TaxID=2695274 RepID=A0A7K1XVH9_9SPHI|nr:RagB/SusD family nutrient uptake outer membrane protein [Hufsiella ginkgonis]MXV14982.1 RagB/SusD family nutrient uptake outer membrane protein [Hufsiella ginkgonis]
MKKILYISALSIAITLLGSCKKFLGLEPLDQISVDQFYKSKYDVDAAMAGMYSAFQVAMYGNNAVAGTGSEQNDRYHFWGEFRADNFDRNGVYSTTTTDQVVMNGLTPDNEFTNWSTLYTVISRANNNIEKIPLITSDPAVTAAVVNDALMQSYAMRAMCYFWIVRIWGDAVIFNEYYDGVSVPAARPRSSADKILDEVIIPDLKKAYGLAVKNQNGSTFLISESAICATLADVYMWKKDYTNAVIWFNNLFASKNPTGLVYGTTDARLQPTASWKSIFTTPTASTETIWFLNWDDAKNGCSCTTPGYSANNKRMRVDPLLVTSYFDPIKLTPNTGDIRPKQTIDLYQRTNAIGYRFVKWYNSPVNPTALAATDAAETAAVNVYYNQAAPVYLPMYRLTDMFLLYAEALNASNNPTGALTYLNYVRKRANVAQYVITDPAVSTKAAMENAILRERQVELIGEGKRWFDLVRTGKVKEVMDPVLKSRQAAAGDLNPVGFPDVRKTLFPINRSVLNSNKLLVQNPSYGD